MEVFSKSDIGRKRISNQDREAHGTVSEDMVWTIVCDGMGGFNGGDVASETATETMKEYFEKNLNASCEDEKIHDVMYEASHLANDKIYEMSKNNSGLSGMGTTVVACVLKGGTAHIMSAGDSRAYLVGKDSISQLTVDHSVVQNMIDSGEITPEEAHDHPQKNIITRALGVEPSISLDYKKLQAHQGDFILLCTDGLTNYLDSLEIYEMFKKFSVSEIPEKLISESNKRGGKDNVTVSIISCKSN